MLEKATSRLLRNDVEALLAVPGHDAVQGILRKREEGGRGLGGGVGAGWGAGGRGWRGAGGRGWRGAGGRGWG